jgi:voltage-gated potassium channel
MALKDVPVIGPIIKVVPFFKDHWVVFAFLPIVYFGCTLMFYYFEEPEQGISYTDALWYGVVTLSTVGYGDYFPGTVGGRIAGAILIVYCVCMLGYVMSLISDTVIKARQMEELGMNGTSFKNHIIICGWGNISKVALLEILDAGRQVVVVTEDKDEIPLIREFGNKKTVFVTYGDPSDKKVLDRANMSTANTIVISTKDDTTNLVTVLNIRKMNPKIRIIVSITNDELKDSLDVAGVTYVASPFEMAGRLLASAAFEPEVAKFIEDISSAAESDDPDDADVQQFTITSNSPLLGKGILDARTILEKKRGGLIVGMGQYNSKRKYDMIVAPEKNIPLKKNDIIIVLGTDRNNQAAQAFLGIKQGR